MKAIDLGKETRVPSVEELELVERLATELHRQYRAAEKAMNRARTLWRRGKKVPNPNLLLHDHGWGSCGQRKYFRRRAELIIARASCTNPQTLGEAEEALAAAVLQRRLIVTGKAAAQ